MMSSLEAIKENVMVLYKDSQEQLIKVQQTHARLLKGTIFLNRLLLSKSVEQFKAIKLNEEHILIDKSGKPCEHIEGDVCECV